MFISQEYINVTLNNVENTTENVEMISMECHNQRSQPSLWQPELSV